MGCGQSKINLYPRRNKNGGKGHSAKKSGAADKEADEEEGAAGSAAAAPPADEDEDHGKHLLPLGGHHCKVVVSESQEDFFKMLDEKIEKGKDYDSSSETEMQKEQERRKNLIQQWKAASLSSYSSQSSPPTPARRRAARPLPQPPERAGSPAPPRRARARAPDAASPPPRRPHSAHSHHATNGDNWHDPTKSPSKRPQSATNWKSNPKAAQYNQKPKKNEVNEQHRSLQNEVESTPNQEVSQVTFNPTFQSHSPAHVAKQPYITQILSYPMSQQVTPPSPPKLIAPPEEYQDPQNKVSDNGFTNTQKPATMKHASSASNIYYIHGNSNPTAQDLAQQRQQTAIHLQQYVAMKQAQQQMYTYFQRSPHTVFPNVEFVPNPNRVYEGEEAYPPPPYTVHPALRPHSAPPPVGVVRPMPMAPGFSPVPDGAHMVQVPVWPHMPPVVSTMGPWAGQVPPEMQYYPQSQFIPMYRSNSAGSAGTLTRYKKDSGDGEVKNVCQSINLVRQKPVGQIVVAGQELCVSNSASDSPSPASVSTDSGVSPGSNSGTAPTKPAPTIPTTSVDSNTNLENKVKRSKLATINLRSLKSSKSLDS